MSTTARPEIADPQRTALEIFEGWLSDVARGLEKGDVEGALAFFTEDCFWKDVLAFGWEYRTFSGPNEVRKRLGPDLAGRPPRRLRVSPDRAAPRLLRRSARTVVEGFFDFDTDLGRGSAFARLQVDADALSEPKAWLLLTALQELHGFEESVEERRPTGIEFSRDFSGENWLDRRRKGAAYGDRRPDVLIVGAGQAGLAVAARLTQIGVDCLLVEKNERVGDNWRRRYHSLTLHNEVWANSLPYMPFPPNWPTFLPKDKLAGWLEAYAEFMELNIWTGTTCTSAEHDDEAGTWTARLEGPGGEELEVCAPHLVLATGTVSGAPKVPTLAGDEDFAGEIVHSSQFSSGLAYAGRRAVVIGTGNSGHDVAQDLASNGAESVTIVQRSPTCVVSLVPSGTMVYALYSEEPDIEDIDLITAAIPYPVLRDSYQWLTKKTCDLDRDLLDRLAAVGFRTDFEPDGTGFHMRYLRTGGGYYINVGCSDLIADGTIDLLQAERIVGLEAEGIRLDDGGLVPADLIVMATGYENQQESVRRLLGDKVAERVGPIWGFDDNQFMRNMWTRTGQPGFWVMGGALNEVRLYSKFLALQIKADLEGLLPPRPAQ